LRWPVRPADRCNGDLPGPPALCQPAWQARAVEPPAAAIEAFDGDRDSLEQLPGGQGGSWRAGSVVLKRCSPNGDASWLGPILSTLPANPSFRLACPVQASDGRWNVEGWEATEWLAGQHQAARWADALVTCRALHTALRPHVRECPAELARRPDNPWRVGDRAAWAEQPWSDVGDVASELLNTVGRQVKREWRGAPPQLIHGDIGLDNLLFADEAGLPPAVIDFSPYWRRAGFAAAVLVADATAWEDAPASLAAEFMIQQRRGRELLARAIVYGLVTGAQLWPTDGKRFAVEVAAYRRVAAALLARPRRTADDGAAGLGS
jgi:uncharacterized protein (TIGR02569 family)